MSYTELTFLRYGSDYVDESRQHRGKIVDVDVNIIIEKLRYSLYEVKFVSADYGISNFRSIKIESSPTISFTCQWFLELLKNKSFLKEWIIPTKFVYYSQRICWRYFQHKWYIYYPIQESHHQIPSKELYENRIILCVHQRIKETRQIIFPEYKY